MSSFALSASGCPQCPRASQHGEQREVSHHQHVSGGSDTSAPQRPHVCMGPTIVSFLVARVARSMILERASLAQLRPPSALRRLSSEGRRLRASNAASQEVFPGFWSWASVQQTRHEWGPRANGARGEACYSPRFGARLPRLAVTLSGPPWGISPALRPFDRGPNARRARPSRPDRAR